MTVWVVVSYHYTMILTTTTTTTTDVLPWCAHGVAHACALALYATEIALADAIAREPVVLEGMSKKEVLAKVLDCINDRCLVREERAPDERFYPRFRCAAAW